MDYVTAIVPSLGVLGLFVIAIRAMFQADRRERLAQAQLDRRTSVLEQQLERGSEGAAELAAEQGGGRDSNQAAPPEPGIG
jgi:hypothetical protein